MLRARGSEAGSSLLGEECRWRYTETLRDSENLPEVELAPAAKYRRRCVDYRISGKSRAVSLC